MWLQIIFYYILDLVLFPGYVGSFIWFVIGSFIFASGFIGIQHAGGINSQLTQAICNIDARKEVITPPDLNKQCYSSTKSPIPCPSHSCVKIDVSYAVGPQTYSGTAYSFPPEDTCFGDQAFEVNNQYYCWYLTNNPGVVYLNKIGTLEHRANIFYGGMILLIISCRLLYLLFNKPTKSENQQTLQLGSITQLFKEKNPLVAICIIAAKVVIGSFMFYGMLLFMIGIGQCLASVNASINGKYYQMARCTVEDIQAEKNKFKLKVSYPVDKLTYTVWSKYRVSVDYKIGNTLPCWYSSSQPQQVTFNPGVNQEDTYFAGLMCMFMGGMILCVLLLISTAINAVASGV